MSFGLRVERGGDSFWVVRRFVGGEIVHCVTSLFCVMQNCWFRFSVVCIPGALHNGVIAVEATGIVSFDLVTCKCNCLKSQTPGWIDMEFGDD